MTEVRRCQQYRAADLVREAAARLRLYSAAVRHDHHPSKRAGRGGRRTVATSPGLFAALWHRGLARGASAVARSEQLPEVVRLHVGEAQAIQLARELALPLLIEETVGRRVAQGLGIAISGIAGQILKAFRQGSLTAQEARNKLLELFQAGRINRRI